FGDLAFGDGDFLWHAVQKIAALDLQRLARTHIGRAGGTDVFLDAFGAGFTDQQVKVTTDIGDDRFVHLVAADAHRTRIDDTAERKHRHFRGATADVDDHGACGFGNRQTRTNRSSHRFLDQEHAAGARGQRGFLNRATFDGSGTGRHADDDHRIREGTAIVHFADEVLDHFFGDFEIGDHAVAHGADSFDVAGRAAQHHLGVVAHRTNLFLAAFAHHGDDRWLVQHNAATTHIDKRVRRTEVDRHVARQNAEKTVEHTLPYAPLKGPRHCRRGLWFILLR